MKDILEPNKPAFKYIIHLADIHIRTGDRQLSRYDQYMAVFDNLISSIHSIKQDKDNILIIIAGDIIHNKNRLENFGAKLLQHLIYNLTSIAPTIIIPGNHDFEQSYPDDPSMLEACLPPTHHNLLFLDKTCCFTYRNIGITTIAIKDTLVKGEGHGIQPDNYTFPLSFNTTPDTIVGIFHGTIRDARLNYRSYVDTNMQAYPTSMLKGINIGILGDIHIPQVHKLNDTCTYSYCGSLIQQDRGEEPFNHGFNIWNINKQTVKFKHVTNPEAYINLSYIDNAWTITNLKEQTPLINCITLPYFPPKIHVQITKDSYKTDNIEKLKNILEQHNISCPNLSIKTVNNLSNSNNSLETPSINNFDIIEDITTNITYQPLISIIKDPYTLIIKDIECSEQLISDCNKKIQDHIVQFEQTKTHDILTNRHFEVLYLEFSNVLCYGKNNIIDFEQYYDNTVLINGKNATGKSALYEIICYALFSEPMPSRKDKHYSGCFINKNKKANETSYTLIHVAIDNSKYSIRKLYRSTNDKLFIATPTITNLDTNELVCQGTNNMKKWIEQHIGTIDDFLKTSMITQNLDNNILDVKPSQIKEDIDNIINVSQIQALKELIKTSKSMHNKLNTVLEDKISSYITSSSAIEYNQDILDTYKETTNKLLVQSNHIREQIDNIHIDYNKYPKSVLDDDNLTVDNIKLPPLIEDDCIKMKHKYEDKLVHIDIYKLAKKYSLDIQHQYDTLTSPDKPDVDISYLEKLYNDVYEYIQNPITKPTHSTDYIEDMINSLTKYRDDIMLQKPKIDVKSSNSIKKVTKQIKELCGDVSTCKSVYQSYNYNSDIASNKIKFDNIDITQIGDTIKTCNGTIKSNEDQITYCKKSLKQHQTQLDTLNKQFREIQHIPKPKISKDKCNEYISNFDNVKSNYNKIIDVFHIFKENIEQIHVLEKQYNQNKDMLDKYNDIEYNPDCHVCIKQPMVKHMLELKSKQEELELNIKKCKTILKDNKYTSKKYNKYNDIIIEYEQMIIHIDRYRDCLIEYTMYEPYLSTCTSLKDDINAIESDIVEVNKQLSLIEDDNVKQKDILNSLYSFINRTHELYNEYIYIQWKTDIDKNDEDLNKWRTELTQSKLYYEVSPKIKNYKKLKDTYDTYQKYINTKLKLERIIDANYYVTTIIPYCNTWDNYNYTKLAVQLRPLHLQKEKLIKEHADVHDRYIVSKEETDKYQTELNHYKNYINTKQSLDTSIATIKTQITELEECDRCINSYHDNLYSNKILPIILSKANHICSLSYHVDGNKIKIGANMDSNGINWMIDVNGDYISIVKASGYQRFVAGLALRLSIPELRQSSHSCKQLFLDEGFTSADHLNIMIVPKLLKTLLSKYTSVILVSHIDHIKNSVDHIINIQVDHNKNSKICK